MPSKYKNDIALNWYSGVQLEHLINNTRGMIKPRDWVAAIAKAIAQTLSVESSIDHELLAVEGGGFLALGNALFEIRAVDYIESGPKALRALRRNVMEQAKTEANSLILAANDHAKVIRTNADAYRSTINLECSKLVAEHEKLKREIAFSIPTWMQTNSIPCRVVRCYGSRVLEFGMALDITISVFRWQQFKQGQIAPATYHLAAKTAPSVPFLFWAPLRNEALDSRFSVERIYPDHHFGGMLPHMDDHACMNIGDAPKHIDGIDNYHRLCESVIRAMSEVNLSSLLVGYNNWHPGLKAMVPANLKKVLEDDLPYTNLKVAEDKADQPITFNAPEKGQLDEPQIEERELL